jgi:Protein of unknown function (DUF3619)
MTNSSYHQVDVLQQRYAARLVSRLSDGTANLPHDVTERLRAGRERALAQRKITATQPLNNLVLAFGTGSGTGSSGDGKFSFWNALVSALPLVALVVGLIAINVVQSDLRANEVAEVDTALLADDLPPAAYADPGFLQFLKANGTPNY